MFVVFEGIDGCGKSTLAKALQERLLGQKPKYSVLLEAEPTRQGVGLVLRDGLRDYRKEVLRDPHFVEYLALAMAADRQFHYWQRIKPAVELGSWVLCDRFCWSSYAYQGALGLDLNWLAQLNSKVPVPDLTVLIKLDPIESMQRVRDKQSDELFEDAELLRSIADLYRYLATRRTGINQIDQADLLVVDGRHSVEQLVEELYHKLIQTGG
jgi:dTMP kinase